MDLIVLTTTYEPDPKRIAERYGIEIDDAMYPVILQACSEVSAIAKPKACYKKAFVTETGPDYVVIDNIRFTSKFLAARLGNKKTVYPYVASCGCELDAWGRNTGDMLLDYCFDDIRQAAVKPALDLLHKTLMANHNETKLSSVNPGSLPQWPLSEQKPLFELMGPVNEKIGVRLDATMLMYPLKSVSGILFESEDGYCNCRVCPRENCPSRRENPDASEMEQMLGF